MSDEPADFQTLEDRREHEAHAILESVRSLASRAEMLGLCTGACTTEHVHEPLGRAWKLLIDAGNEMGRTCERVRQVREAPACGCSHALSDHRSSREGGPGCRQRDCGCDDYEPVRETGLKP